MDPNSQSEENPRSWAWHNRSPPCTSSTVSVLAIAETVLATTAVVYIALKYGTLHLTVSACIAPFLLLRTPRSTEIGINIADKSEEVLGKIWKGISEKDLGFIVLLAFFLYISISALFARICGTTAAVLACPLRSLCALPANWWQFVAVIDLSSEVEAVPGAKKSNTIMFDASNMMIEIYQDRDPAIRYTFLPIYFVFVFLPALLYRISLKGTALIYSPLIYVVYSSFPKDSVELFREIRDLALHRLMRMYSACVIVVFLCKLYLFMAWGTLAPTWQAIPGIEKINAYVLPDEIAPWHIASLVSALLTWCAYLVADYLLARLDRESAKPMNMSVVGKVMGVMWVCRGVLSIYSIACVLYITASLVPDIDWPALGSKWFPWSDEG